MTETPKQGAGLPVSRETAGLLMGLIGVVIFGGSLPATRIALVSFSPWFISFGRAALASLAAAILLLILRRAFPRGDFLALFLSGLLLVFAFPVMSAIALQTVPASHGGVVLGILPLSTSIFAALLGGERPSPLFWLCGVVGAALIIAFAARENGMALQIGDLWLFGAAVLVSIGYVIAGKLSQKMPGWEVICWSLMVTAPISLVGVALSWRPEFAAAGSPQIAAFVYVSFGSMFLGFFAWNIGLAMGGIARVSQVQLFQTFVTLAISAAVLSEPVGFDTLLFAVAVVAVVALGRKARVSGALPA